MNKRITIADLLTAKNQEQKIVAISCYDYTTARLAAQAEVDMILVGDSAAQWMLGFDSTLPATMNFMVAITAAVRRGAPNAYLVADMPFLSYQLGTVNAIRNAGRFIAEAGAQMVKLEVASAHSDIVKAVSDAGIAVMAHIGIRPQRISKVGRLRAEATTAEVAMELIDLARQMINAGASALLLEGTATEVAEVITQRSCVPVIGCGSGPACDGQILIAPDILGLTNGQQPKFSKTYANLSESVVQAIQSYRDEVKTGSFPDTEHSYHMKPGELDKLNELLTGM
jgi:3-methyl-2-oxobutanoate hydroxymethyltransferase